MMQQVIEAGSPEIKVLNLNLSNKGCPTRELARKRAPSSYALRCMAPGGALLTPPRLLPPNCKLAPPEFRVQGLDFRV
jgi:hypothetical protein